MRRGTTGVGRRAARRWASLATSLVAATVGLVAVMGPAAAAPTTSRAPSSPVSALINQIAQVNQNLSDLDSAVAARQEAANHAVVDYQNAVAAQRLAAVAADDAQQSLGRATRATEAAQREFDQFVRSVYRTGGNEGTLTEYLSSSDPQKVLDRVTVINQLGRDQQQTIRRLQVARNQQANQVAALQATKRQTAYAAQSAQTRRDDAVAAVSAARGAIADQQRKRATLVQQRNAVQTQLDKLRGTARPTQVDAPAPADLLTGLFRNLPGQAQPGPVTVSPTQAAGDNDAMQVAAEAAARLALDVTQKVLSGLVGQQQVPHSELLDELGLGGAGLGSDGGDTLSSRLGSGSLGQLFGSSGGGGGGVVRPGLRGPQAVEIVVNRALSQLNVPYAWGGGDANGPTQGIRDGGVADSYGDYNKIGFDCSGLMVYAFAGVGIELPHYTGYQYTSGPQFPLAQMQRGDMIFYGPNASEHVALYLGDGKMVEAPQSGDVVKVSPVRTDGAMPNVVRLL
ncbi:NlpC/P60 family protein [Gordonia polyisoprenivorans VH2]|uniref:NlpC/P60 family protein n=2 Tax=Gordonia polyisoprenivorans TaxID=84595 RepID=H6N1P7_GORPV|nr:NlpC/P60 family protein [Gordonia polyisoprenivorans]AFA73366.1 NlpC/P60 family protein [Gordonia polyisoprenivorans VH2]NKY02333.1 C40 family peptidase [Gordonia polyisoprenivorans]OZC30471.1 hydrolase Nlp/P60 [Gordonia polyisoprenivorans]QUD85138.1 C40 family peptidase [Gordonia polyisoprenivorans]UZF58802.1 NlpC/P60 family protein [Gordonia polyisoprenivorans]